MAENEAMLRIMDCGAKLQDHNNFNASHSSTAIDDAFYSADVVNKNKISYEEEPYSVKVAD